MAQLSFEPLRETWGEYRLRGGILVRARPELVFAFSVTDKPAATPESTDLNIRIVTSVSSLFPANLQGDPSTEPVDFAKDRPAETYKEWETIRPAECFYLLQGGALLHLTLRPTEIKRFPNFNKDREPVVQVLTQTNIVILPNPSSIKLPEVAPSP